jgi:tetratricopeptide (TPR) repeat protein
MDVDNANGQKFHFDNSKGQPFHFYYKNFLDAHYVEPDNFDIAIGYFQKALQQSPNKEDKAKILFQMAQAEQGNTIREAAQNSNTSYSDKDYDAKMKKFDNMLLTTKNQKFRTYFAEPEKNYNNTSTVKALN